MRRSLKVAAWAAAFLAAAGIGAVIAAHSNPFPPGVELQRDDAAYPRQLARSPVRAPQHRVHQVKQRQHDERGATEVVQAAHQVAHEHLELNVVHRGPGVGGAGRVPRRQRQAGERFE